MRCPVGLVSVSAMAVLVASHVHGATLQRRSLNLLRQVAIEMPFYFEPNNIPSQCQANCKVLADALNFRDPACSNGVDLNCVCRNVLMNGMASCFSCYSHDVDNSGLDVSNGQTSVDHVVASCNKAGISVTSTTVQKNAASRVGVEGFTLLAAIALGAFLTHA
ncbi:hypothetical protein Hypma_004224 [Hypsizygus marmoreus]|uniref:Extracellular membrane protein CFEM domain-containing protein n=1 Tax=Hypsizygus marmoreus TaxID=39966 RepID=A0A369J282_HYPMA|nr:hypothetical protein Hypma_004224 [Hypsizygus marmoreus]